MARPSKYDWEEIRNAYECGKTVEELVSKYGVTKKTLQNRISNQLWNKSKRNTNLPFCGESGFVYIIYFKDTNKTTFYKIGYAKNVKTRISDLQTGNPFEINIMFCFYCNNMRDTEKELHIKFKNLRYSKEWFNLEEENINNIKSFILNTRI